MDWWRKMFGYNNRQKTDGNPFQSPTWDEIVAKKESKNYENSADMQHPWGHFFHGGFHNNDMFSPPEFEDSHIPVFGQMDDMFSHLESMMRELHRHPAWELPDSNAKPEPQTPRDYMLKEPDSEASGTVPSTVPNFPPYGYDGEDRSDSNSNDGFRGNTNPFTFNPHSFFDRIFQNFGIHPGETPFSGHHPNIEAAPDLGEHSRESLIRKDSDIDERVSGDLSNLPQGSPGYTLDVPQSPDVKRSPWSHIESPGSQPAVQHKFFSQSIVTIRRPDGSIEETKKYTDSTGREEVTVTHKQPDSGSFIQPEKSASDVPSIFSWFFTR